MSIPTLIWLRDGTEAARQDGLIRDNDLDDTLPEVLARPWTCETDPRGQLELVADRHRQILAGAWAVAPLASEWIHHAALAIKAQLPLGVLRDLPAQFPTYSEGYLTAIEQLTEDSR